jgi:hypothetical protein
MYNIFCKLPCVGGVILTCWISPDVSRGEFKNYNNDNECINKYLYATYSGKLKWICTNNVN